MISINDRFTRGMVAGFLAWIPTLVINSAARFLNISTLMYLDFAAVMVYGHRPTNTFETYFALAVTLMFMSVLGGVFAYLLKWIGPQSYIMKGWVFGAGVWFSVYAITLLYKAPQLTTVPFKTAIANFAGASIYGIVLAYILIYLNGKFEARVKPVKVNTPVEREY